MDAHEVSIHSFVIKIWLEDQRDTTGQPIWHGYITHIPSQERQYLRSIGDVVDAIHAHVGILAPHTEQRPRLWRWLRQIVLFRNKRRSTRPTDAD